MVACPQPSHKAARAVLEFKALCAITCYHSSVYNVLASVKPGPYQGSLDDLVACSVSKSVGPIPSTSMSTDLILSNTWCITLMTHLLQKLDTIDLENFFGEDWQHQDTGCRAPPSVTLEHHVSWVHIDMKGGTAIPLLKVSHVSAPLCLHERQSRILVTERMQLQP